MNINTLKAFFTKKRLIIIGAVLFVVLLSIGAGIYIQNTKKPATSNAGGVSTVSYDDAVKSGAVDPANKEVLVVNLSYDATQKPEVTLKGLKRYTSSTPNSPTITPSDYKLEILRDGESLYSDYFAKQSDTIAESFTEGQSKISGKMVSKSTDISLTIPWFGENTDIRIIDITGNVLLSQSLKDVQVVNNTPSFDTIQGQDVK